MGLRLFKHSAEVDVYLASMQQRFDVLRQVSTLQAERMHHFQQIERIDAQLARLAQPLRVAIAAIQGEKDLTPPEAA